MAKEVSGLIKLQVKGAAANPSPPIGPALGSKGVNIMEFASNSMPVHKIWQEKFFLLSSQCIRINLLTLLSRPPRLLFS